MPIIQWNQNLSVGVPEIDKQHQRLVKLVNDLHDALHAGKGNDVAAGIIQELVSYSKTHFVYEERQLATAQYPDLGSHKAAHADLIKKVEEFASRIAKGQPGVSIQLSAFLGDWLKTHIMGTDKKYSPFLAQKVAK
jgi:hemerythrin